jgi:hypothetical protein
MAVRSDKPKYRYRVVGSWGKIPPDVYRCQTEQDVFLVYDEFQGPDHSVAFTDHGEIVGGWLEKYAGKRPVSRS